MKEFISQARNHSENENLAKSGQGKPSSAWCAVQLRTSVLCTTHRPQNHPHPLRRTQTQKGLCPALWSSWRGPSHPPPNTISVL
jgi:hypothetical protein